MRWLITPGSTKQPKLDEIFWQLVILAITYCIRDASTTNDGRQPSSVVASCRFDVFSQISTKTAATGVRSNTVAGKQVPDFLPSSSFYAVFSVLDFPIAVGAVRPPVTKLLSNKSLSLQRHRSLIVCYSTGVHRHQPLLQHIARHCLVIQMSEILATERAILIHLNTDPVNSKYAQYFNTSSRFNFVRPTRQKTIRKTSNNNQVTVHNFTIFTQCLLAVVEKIYYQCLLAA